MSRSLDDYVFHDFSKLTTRDVYGWMISTIVPRPIAFVTTMNHQGIVNLAPFSFFTGVSSNPPCLLISITRHPDGRKKDTLLNIEATREFVVNSTHEWLVNQINSASANEPPEVSELEVVGLNQIPSMLVKPPRVAECLFHHECRLEKFVEIGDGGVGSSTIVVGRILGTHISDRILTAGKVDFKKIKPLSRLGGQEWSMGGEVFSLERPRPSKR